MIFGGREDSRVKQCQKPLEMQGRKTRLVRLSKKVKQTKTNISTKTKTKTEIIYRTRKTGQR
jgi:hypothetical protein